MNPKLRFLYLFLGFAGLFCLVYNIVTTFPNISRLNVVSIAILDILFFSLAYRTYPVEDI